MLQAERSANKDDEYWSEKERERERERERGGGIKVHMCSFGPFKTCPVGLTALLFHACLTLPWQHKPPLASARLTVHVRECTQDKLAHSLTFSFHRTHPNMHEHTHIKVCDSAHNKPLPTLWHIKSSVPHRTSNYHSGAGRFKCHRQHLWRSDKLH